MSVKYDRSIAAQEHAIFKHQFQRSREDNFFHITAGLSHVRRTVSVIHRDDLVLARG